MLEIWELIEEKVMHGLLICTIIAVVVLLGVAVWHLVIYNLTRSRIESAKQIYNAIRLDEPKENARSCSAFCLGSGAARPARSGSPTLTTALFKSSKTESGNIGRSAGQSHFVCFEMNPCIHHHIIQEAI